MLRQINFLTIIIVLLMCSTAFATSGFNVTSQSAKASAMSDAFIAQSDDPSANNYNPAGLTAIEGTQFSMGMMMVYQSETEFEGQVLNPSTGGYAYSKEASKDAVLVAPHLYAAHKMENGIVFGLGINASYPLMVSWSASGELAQLSYESSFLPLTVNPNIAYKFDKLGLSVGAGVDYTFAFASREVFVPAGSGSASGSIGSADLTGGDFGYNLGLQWETADWLTLGAAYRSGVELGLSGDYNGIVYTGTQWVTFSQDLEQDVKLPSSLVIGAAFKPLKNLTIEIDVQRTDFSDYQGLFGKGETSDGFRIGGQYSLNENWDLRAGYSFDDNVMPNDSFGPDLPIGEFHQVSGGFGYHTDRYAVDMAMGYLMHNADVDNVYNTGSYEGNVTFGMLTFTFKL